MQRAFHAFPYGAPGLALVALRACVAAQLLLGSWGTTRFSSWLPAATAIVAIALVVGIATPLAAVLDVLARLMAVSMAYWDLPLLFDSSFALILAVLGPGAYSLDAQLYGRRVVVIKDLDDSPSDSDRPSTRP